VSSSVLLIGNITSVRGSNWSALATLSRESIGVAAAPDRLLITNYYCLDPREIISVNSTGAATVFASLPSRGGGCYEDYLAISPGLGGFPLNHVYVDQGPKIMETDQYGTFLGVFATIPSLPPDHNGITFDHVGSFGFDMILTGSNGQIWRLNHSGASTLVTTLGGAASFEGPEVAPIDFGSFGGDLFLTSENNGTILAVAPSSSVTVVGSWSIAESIRFIPSTPCNFGSTGAPFFDIITGPPAHVLMFPSSNFLGNTGRALVTGESTSTIGLLYANGTIANFASGVGTNQEGSAFVDCSLPAVGPGFSINNSGNITIVQGGSGNNSILVGTVGGFSQSVGLSCTNGLPSGATCSFNPASGVPQFSSMLTISTPSSTPLGSYTINVTGTGGGQTHTTQFRLNVVTFDFGISNSGSVSAVQSGSGSNVITASLVSGSSILVNLSCTSGLPTGALCSFNPGSGFPTFSSTLTVSTLSSTPTGSFAVTVTGVGGGVTRTTQFTLTVITFDFSMSSSSNIGLVQGGSGSDTISVSLLGGPSQSTTAVDLSCSGLPSGAQCGFVPSSSSPTFTSTLTVSTMVSTPTGAYTVTVTGTGGGLTRTTHFMLTVSAQGTVGGSLLPIDKLALLAPYMISVFALFGVVLAMALFFRRTNRKRAKRPAEEESNVGELRNGP
jgi:hypothetical protein